MKRYELTTEKIYCLAHIFNIMIVDDGVNVFYTTASNEFDSICEEILTVLIEEEHKDKNISIIKIADRDDDSTVENTPYDFIYRISDNDYMKRCRLAARKSNYIVYDSIKSGSFTKSMFKYSIKYGLKNKRMPAEYIELNKVMKEIKKAQSN